MFRKLLLIMLVTVNAIAIPIAGGLFAQAVNPGTTQKPLTPLVSPQTLPVTPDSIEIGQKAGDLVELLRDALQNWILDNDMEKSVKEILPIVERDLPQDSGGYLIRVDIYKNANGIKVLGTSNNVVPIGHGTIPSDAAERWLSKASLSANPPSGMLKSEEDSFLIWITRQGDKFSSSQIPYPFAQKTFEIANERLTAKRAEEARKEAERKAEEARQAQERAVESARRTLEQLEAARKVQEQMEAARKAIEQAEAARRAVEQAEAARKAVEQAEAARKAAEQAEAARKATEQAEAARKAAEQAEAARKQVEAARKAAEAARTIRLP